MDLGIRLISYLCGNTLAQFAVLGAEYAPEPPFETGTPESAGAELTALSREPAAVPDVASRVGIGPPRLVP